MNKWSCIKRIGSMMLIALLLLGTSFTSSAVDSPNVAKQVVKDMGVGWNLGKSLDAYSFQPMDYDLKQQKRDNYQIMGTYSTKSYSGWDASSAPYFSSKTSEGSLTWNITKLNSKDQACGYFGFIIINNALVDSGMNKLNFTVTKAQFTTKGGEVLVLQDMIGDYSKTIVNKTSPLITADLSKLSQLSKTSDILGGTLNIVVKINTYPMPKNAKSITKEAYYETLWGNPIITKSMLTMVKEAGFNTVRVPVTFYNHLDAEGNIDPAWLTRVEEVVGYVLNNDMYCIINMQGDVGPDGWIKADLSTLPATKERYAKIWNQIAEHFKDYDQKLLFEGYNEILNSKNYWNYAGQDSYDAANQLNQVFVDTVRATGSNNSSRCLIVNSYAASIEQEVLNHFVLPTDTVPYRLIVGVHYYGSSKSDIDTMMKRLNEFFVSKEIPVIVGEFGTPYTMNEESRKVSAEYYISKAKDYSIACLWWDDGNYEAKAGSQCYYAIYDRVGMKWYHPNLVQSIVNASKLQ